jgi:hypothetical protein
MQIDGSSVAQRSKTSLDMQAYPAMRLCDAIPVRLLQKSWRSGSKFVLRMGGGGGIRGPDPI